MKGRMMTENLPARREDRAPVKVDLTKPIADLDEALRLADALARSDLVPSALKGRPANILHVLVTGQEMGLKWPVSLRVIYCPGPGQIGIRGQLLLAKLREAGHDYDWEEGDGFCKFTLTRAGTDGRPGKSYASEFTIRDAITAGLAKQQEDGRIVALSQQGKPMPWMQYTPRMLFWRAVADCVNRAAPEVLLGFEIAGAEPPAEPEPDVVLRPAEPAPPGPAGGEAAPADGQAAQLAELDRRMRERVEADLAGHGIEPDAPETAAPAGQPENVGGNLEHDTMGGNAPASGGPAQASHDSHTAYGGPAQAINDGQDHDGGPAVTPESPAGPADLARRFAELGWNPKRHRPDVLRACTMYLRRPVGSVVQMDDDEIQALYGELSAIQRSFEPGHYPVALADAVETWRASWEAADPAGYAEGTR